MSRTLFKNALLVTMNPARQVYRGHLLAEQDRIVALRASVPGEEHETISSALLTARDQPARVVDAEHCALLPGFVQAHIHLCQTLFRNHAEDLQLLEWLQQKIWPFEAAHTESSMRISARLGMAVLLAGGSTTILDMGSVHHYDAVFEEAERLGLRLVGGKCMMDTGENVPLGLRESTDESLRASERLMRHWHGAATGRLRYAFAPRFTLSCSEKLWQGVAERARDAKVSVHTHASETAQEEALLVQRKNLRTIAFLRALDIRGPHCCFAHGVHLDDADRKMLAQDGTAIAHCPSSNLKLASGLAPVAELRRAGVKVGLGADGAPCNNNLDMFKEMCLAGMIQKVRLGPTALGAQEIVEMATITGAACLGLQDEIGSLEAGKKADVTLLRLDRLHSAPVNDEDVYAQIVYAALARDVSLTMVDGRIVYERGEFAACEAPQVVAQAEEELHQLLQRVRV
jgi:cytosine/adenosine deaminase-related metal-dependent hydrolase